jgi:hypothetical protein
MPKAERDPISEVRPAGKPERSALARLAGWRDYGRRVVGAEAEVDERDRQRAIRNNKNQQAGRQP